MPTNTDPCRPMRCPLAGIHPIFNASQENLYFNVQKIELSEACAMNTSDNQIFQEMLSGGFPENYAKEYVVPIITSSRSRKNHNRGMLCFSLLFWESIVLRNLLDTLGREIYGYLEKEIQTPMAQGRSTYLYR
jgi:hypothetical protein